MQKTPHLLSPESRHFIQRHNGIFKSRFLGIINYCLNFRILLLYSFQESRFIMLQSDLSKIGSTVLGLEFRKERIHFCFLFTCTITQHVANVNNSLFIICHLKVCKITSPPHNTKWGNGSELFLSYYPPYNGKNFKLTCFNKILSIPEIKMILIIRYAKAVSPTPQKASFSPFSYHPQRCVDIGRIIEVTAYYHASDRASKCRTAPRHCASRSARQVRPPRRRPSAG